jgi:SAM-dependent MidA family methyltransferase
MNQGNFLASMGIVERVEQLIDDDQTSEKQATDLYHALERLLLPDQMGERYQVLAIVKDDENNRNPPAGFQ